MIKGIEEIGERLNRIEKILGIDRKRLSSSPRKRSRSRSPRRRTSPKRRSPRRSPKEIPHEIEEEPKYHEIESATATHWSYIDSNIHTPEFLINILVSQGIKKEDIVEILLDKRGWARITFKSHQIQKLCLQKTKFYEEKYKLSVKPHKYRVRE